MSSPSAKSTRLEGKVALITGGASGIGAATARLFIQHGAKVIVADIQDDLGQALCQEIRSQDQDDNNICFVHCDVTKESDVENAVESAVSKFGKLDILYSNAGVVGDMDSSVSSSDKNNMIRVFDINVLGAFLCAKHASKVMIPARKGSIIFTASISSFLGGIAPHAYASSKNAVVGLSNNLCAELGQHGIRVNCISPHTVDTPMMREGLGDFMIQKVKDAFLESANLKGAGVLEAEDIAQAAVYLGSDESKFVSGINLVIDGGYSKTNPAFPMTLKSMLS